MVFRIGLALLAAGLLVFGYESYAALAHNNWSSVQVAFVIGLPQGSPNLLWLVSDIHLWVAFWLLGSVAMMLSVWVTARDD